MSKVDFALKRTFDLIAALVGLALLWPIIAIAWYLAGRDTGASGLFRQRRIGRDGRVFCILKLRTMQDIEGTSVTVAGDARITRLGALLRRYKIDELPQLWNVLIGDMSFVGPRPDVPGFLDRLEGEDRALLKLRPGITGPATIKYRNEAELLANAADPETYNREVIWPDKVGINLDYMRNWSLAKDFTIILRTVAR